MDSAGLGQRSRRSSSSTLDVSPAKAAGRASEVTPVNWFWLNIPLMVVFFLAIAGIPLWMTFRRPDAAPATAIQPSRVARPEHEERTRELVGASR
jgi:hypothetical protein